MKLQMYTDEQILLLLRNWGKRLGLRNLRLKMKAAKTKPCVNTIQKRFGGFREALVKAGVPFLHGGRVTSKINTLTPMDAKYIAGLIDCEGSISRSGRNSSCYRITFVSKDKEFIDYYQKLINGGKVCFCGGTYRVELRKNEVLDLLPQVYPYFIVKKEAADNLIQYIRKEQSESKFNEPFIPLNLEENLKKYKPNYVPIEDDF